MRKIILDTNVLISRHKIDIFSEISRICDFNYKICIIDKTLDELKRKKEGKLAIELLKFKNVDIIKTSKEGIVDNLIMQLAEKDKDIKIITIRQNKYLEFVN